MRKSTLRLFSLIMVVIFVVSYAMPLNNAFAESSADANSSVQLANSDTKGHWAEGQINKWIERKIVKGYEDQSFHPNNEVTRAEFLAIINRVLGSVGGASASFSDVAKDAWYAEDVAKGTSAGIINGYTDQTFRPNQKLARQDAAVILGRAFHLAAKKEAVVAFKDEASIGEYAKSAVQALAEQAYLNGYSDQTFGPNKFITRAETVALLDRLVAEIYPNSGSFEAETIKGNVVVNTDKVTLKNTIVEGDLFLTTGIAQGDSTLDHVTVKGKTVITGGGAHSIHIHNSDLGEVVINKADNDIRVEATGATTIKNIILESGVRLEGNTTGSGGINKVSIPQNEAKTTATLSGEFKAVEVGSSNASLNVEAGSVEQLVLNAQTMLKVGEHVVVTKMTINAAAAGSNIQVKGTIKDIDIQAANTEINGKKVELGSGLEINNGGELKIKPTATATSTPGSTTPSSPASTSPTTSPTNQWTLAWSDEFNGSAIDTSKWGFDIGRGASGDGWGNNEIQYYTNDEKNVKQENGNLVITAVRDEINTVNGAVYTSSRLVTKGKHAQKYGKIEVRAKTPEGAGFWPAIWMLPENNKYGVWAASGEIDIMENQGRLPNTVSGTLHYGEEFPGNTYSGKAYNLPNNGTVADFHTYALEWEPGEFRWYVDGVLYQTQNDWYSKSLNQGANNTYPAPFDEPYHLLLNLALGGNFDGNILPDAALYPAKMEVDYVRMYDLTGRPYREPKLPVLAKEDLPSDAKPALSDGNLVYNAGFNQDDAAIANLVNPDTSTVANTDYWSLFTGVGGDGSVSIDAINNINYAKIDIANQGSQNYSVQLLNTISIAKGRYYKVSFDAKASEERNLIFKVTGGQSRGFVAYSQAETMSLTKQIQSYSLSFQMKQDTDIAARTEFNLGLNNQSAWIGNVRVEEIDSIIFDDDVQKIPLNGGGNHLYNGTFDQGRQDRLTYWHVSTANKAVATASVSEVDRKLSLDITHSGDGEIGSINLLQKGIYLIKGQTYQLTFDADSTSNRTIEVELTSKDGAISYAKQSVSLDALTATKSLSFPAITEATDHEAQFIVHLGGSTGSIHMDNFKLIRTSIYFEPEVVFYPLVNGNFEEGMSPWSTVSDSGGAISGAIVGGEAKLTITNQGLNPYSTMFNQGDLKLFNGLVYTLQFDARASVNRRMQLDLENSSYTRYFDETVDLTTENQSFSFDFTMTKDEVVSLKFFNGLIANTTALGITHDVYLDNVVVQVKNAPVLRSPRLIADISNNKVGQPIQIAFTDNTIWRDNITSVKINNEIVAAEDYTLTAGEITFTAKSFAAAANYTIRIDASGFAFATVAQNIMADDGNLILNGNMGKDFENWKFYVRGDDGSSASRAISNGVAQVLFNNIGIANWSVQFYQEGIPLLAGKTYQLTFKASSTANRPIKLEYTDTPIPAEVYKLTAALTEFTSAKFTVPADDILKLNFLIANVVEGSDVTPNIAHTISFDDFVLKEVEAGIEEPSEEGGTLLNGTFDTDLSHWESYSEAGGTAAVIDGSMEYTINSPGPAVYSNQIKQSGLKLEQGSSYTVTFDVYGSMARTIRADFESAGYFHYADIYNNSHSASPQIDVTTEKATVTFNFTMNSATDNNAILVFLFGNVDANVPIAQHKVFLDNIQIVKQL